MHFPKGLVCVLRHIQLFATPWTVFLQAPLSMGFSQQEYWSGLPFPSPGRGLSREFSMKLRQRLTESRL